MPQISRTQSSMLLFAFFAALVALMVSYSVDAEPLSEQTAPTSLVAAAPSSLPFELPTLAPSAIVLDSQRPFHQGEGVVKLFFAPSKTDIAPSAEPTLLHIAQSLQEGRRVQIAGFHDETGNPQHNIILSKKRAEVVQKRLIALGAPATAIELRKPAMADTNTDHALARRVEIAYYP